MTHITCRLTAENRDQFRNPTLSNRVCLKTAQCPNSLIVGNHSRLKLTFLQLTTHHVCDYTLPCDLSSITISVSDRCLFYDIRVSQGSVTTRMRCGVISNYNFTPNLPLSQSTEEFWHRFGVFLFVDLSVNNTTILIYGIILCFMFYYMFLHLLHNLMSGGGLACELLL